MHRWLTVAGVCALLVVGMVAVPASPAEAVAGPVRIEINPGLVPSSPSDFVDLGGLAVFAADDGTNGRELWVSDGTAAGTSMVADINPGAGSSSPSELIVLGTLVLFQADDGTDGIELWASDGTAAGTSMLADINPGAGDSSPQEFAVLGSQVLFQAFRPAEGVELWASDGTAAGTGLLADINPGVNSSQAQNLTEFNGDMYFAAFDPANGAELWVSDGTGAGTSMVTNVAAGFNSSTPFHLVDTGGLLMFRATDGLSGHELWATDGTGVGTYQVEDIWPGVAGSSPGGTELFEPVAIGGTIYFNANDGTNGQELWTSDGTAAGTFLVEDINPGVQSSSPHELVAFKGKAHFAAIRPGNGTELWFSDGTAAGTDVLVDIFDPSNPALSAAPRHLTVAGDSLFFSAQANANIGSRELWVTDGTVLGTAAAGDLNPGSSSSSPDELASIGGNLFLQAFDDTAHFELWFVNAATPNLTLLQSPCPLYDSTTATGSGLSGPMAANTTRTVDVTGSLPGGQGVGTDECVPVGATSVLYTISAIDPLGAGNLRLSESGVVAQGGVVNYSSNGLNNANTVTVPLGGAGQADIFANAAGTDVRLVAVGYFSSSGARRYTPVTPCAAADSRPAEGPSGSYVGPFGGGAAYPDVDVVGAFSAAQGGGNTDCGVPASAHSVMVNLVAVRPTGGFGGSGFLAAGTGGTDPNEPGTPFADLTLNNATTAVVTLEQPGTIAIDVEAVSGTPSSHIRVVVLGYFGAELGASNYSPVNPCAGFDTRPGQGPTGAFLGLRNDQSATIYDVVGTIPSAQGGGGGDCGVPTGASAVLINLVSIAANAPGNFRAYATGTSPTGGVLNFTTETPPINNSNAVVVPLSAAGQLTLFTNAPANAGGPTTHARGVILGYFD